MTNKKVVSLWMAFVRFLFILSFALNGYSVHAQNTYYVDSRKGNDSNNNKCPDYHIPFFLESIIVCHTQVPSVLVLPSRNNSRIALNGYPLEFSFFISLPTASGIRPIRSTMIQSGHSSRACSVYLLSVRK